MTASEIITHLGLEPLHVEGGYFRETYRSSESLTASCLPPCYGSARSFSTAIYYLLTDDPDSFSALHRLRSDEVFHFYMGDLVEMLLLRPDGSSKLVILGPNILSGQQVQFVVPRGCWEGARLLEGGRFALLGATVAPGFDYADLELGSGGELVARHPDHAALIRALTRL